MSYIKTTWVTGDIVTAPRMNNMEGGIYNNDAAITELQSEVTDTQSDVSTLQTNVSTLQSNVSTLQTNVTNLQTITGNLVPSIADVFSTSSTYAVGDHVMYNGRLYECKTAVTSAGAWNASAWEAVSVFKYDDVVGVIKITNTSTTMATIETTLAEINTANDHIVFDVSVLSAGMHLCTIYLSDGKYRITDLATGFDGEGLYSGTDTLVSILQKGSAPFYNVSTEPYTFRAINAGIGDKESLDSIVGGSLGWNQLVHNLTSRSAVQGITRTVSSDGTSMTYTGTATTTDNYTAFAFYPVVGHKYLMTLGNATLPTGAKIVGATQDKATSILVNITTSAYSLGITINSGVVCNFTIQPMAIDLTAMFGTTIADYIYSLESSAAGSGIAWLRKYIDIDSYHEYDAGSIQSVQATAHVTTGFNQFDEVVEAGYWDVSTGQKASGGNWMRCANYIPVLPNTEYKIHFTSGSGSQGSLIYLDGNKSVISYISSYISTVITTPSNCRYMVFYANNGWFGGNICINISRTSGTPKNGDYVPYTTYTYPLGSDTLRGVPQLVNNKLAFDGDIKTPDGTIRRKYDIVDLGSLNWNIGSSGTYRRFYTTETNLAKLPATQDVTANIISAQYQNMSLNALLNTDKAIAVNTTGAINISDSAYASSTAAQFKAAMSGKYLVYEKQTPTTETSSAYQRVQEAPQGGTEAFITNTIVPVGHYTRNPGNMLAAVELVGDDKEENPIYSEDSTIYTIRKVENVGVAGKESLEKLIGGSLGWNQLIPTTGPTKTDAGITFTNNGDGSWTVTGTSTADTVFANLDYVANKIKYISGHVYYIGGIGSNVNLQMVASGTYSSITATGQTIRKFSASSITASWARLQVATSGTTVNTTVRPQVIDLTQAFGSTIADYVYGLESATAGAGVAWLSRYIDLSTYYAYDAGSIQSVQATAHVTTGKNLLDVTNETSGSNAHIREYNLPNLLLGTYTVSAKCVSTASTDCAALFIYKDGTNTASPMLTNGSWSSQTFNLTKPVKSFRIYSANGYTASQSNTVVVTSAQLEFGSTATAYEPYTSHTYPLGSDTLRGIPQLVNGELAYDGDVKTPDGTILRKRGFINLNGLTLTYNSSNKWLYSGVLDNVLVSSSATPNAIVDLPSNYVKTAANSLSTVDEGWTIYQGKLHIRNVNLTEAQLRTVVSGKHLEYALVTPTTESSTPYQRIQTISADGTESFTTSTPVPVGHYTQYAENTLAEIDAIGDGLDDIGEEKAVAIPDSAFTLGSGVTILTNSLFKYKNMVMGTIVFQLATQQANESREIATIAPGYRPLIIERTTIGCGLQGYQVQEVGYGAITEAGIIRVFQQSTGKPYVFFTFSYMTA